MDIIFGGIWWQIPDTRSSRAAYWVRSCRIETEEFNDTIPVFVGRAVLVLFPFLDGSVADSKPQHFSQLRHGQLHVDPLFAEMLSQGFGCGRVAA
jgi:uncharacterized hydantoinase/oxoprolinase family protein